ncbi:MAG: carboxypeptidase regulatory-like domain-containing protein, partial [Planctomycetota bacterium]
LLSLLLLFVILVTGCSKSDSSGSVGSETEPSKNAGTERATKIKYDSLQATATIKGVVKFEGQPPQPKELRVTEKYCIENFYKDKPLYAETVVVNPNNTLKNVAVYVKEGAEKWDFEPPQEAKTINQQGCRYIPHLLTLQVNQPLEILNSDPFLHNVHTSGEINPELNFGQPKQGMKTTTTFKHPEVVVFKCDVHSWMSAYIVVLPHPFSSVTDDKGEFTIKLPPGDWTIEAWHEKYGTQTQKVTVSANETKEIIFTYKGE